MLRSATAVGCLGIQRRCDASAGYGDLVLRQSTEAGCFVRRRERGALESDGGGDGGRMLQEAAAATAACALVGDGGGIHWKATATGTFSR